jgi:hypothetical protein
MKTLLITMACLVGTSTAFGARAKENEARGVKSSEVRGCYAIKVDQFFFKANLYLNIPGDGTFSFLADTRNQGPMSVPCVGTIKNTEFTAAAQVNCEKMLAVSKTKKGKPYDWEKNFKLDINLAKAKLEGSTLRKVVITNTQGSNGAKTTMTVDMQSQTCR